MGSPRTGHLQRLNTTNRTCTKRTVQSPLVSLSSLHGLHKRAQLTKRAEAEPTHALVTRAVWSELSLSLTERSPFPHLLKGTVKIGIFSEFFL